MMYRLSYARISLANLCHRSANLSSVAARLGLYTHLFVQAKYAALTRSYHVNL